MRRTAAIVAMALGLFLGGITQAQAQTQTIAVSAFAGSMAQASAAIFGGDFDGAIAAAKQAFKQASTRDEKAAAARLVASAQFRAGRYSWAQWWLRRAAHNADGPMAQAVASDFAVVRQANPLTVSLNFSLAPSNNINNGSASDTVFIWNLPFLLSADARALSGMEMAAAVDVQYRVGATPVSATFVGASVYGRTYTLSSASRAAAPGVRGRDYSFSALDLSLRHIQQFEDLPGVTTATLNVGQQWYGGDALTRYQRLTLGQDFVVSDTMLFQAFGGFENQLALDGSNSRSHLVTLGGAVISQLGNGDQLQVSAQVQRTESQDLSLENTVLRAGVRYGFAQPVLGTGLSLSLNLEKRDYGFSPFDPTGRNDLTLSAAATMVFNQTSYFGFSPTLSVEAAETRSNIGLYDRKSVSVRTGLQSNF